MVRIYTPNSEVPFAGHPNIGTAFILAKNGVFGTLDTGKEVVFEEKAGLVPIKIKRDESGYIWCELSAPEVLSIRDPVSKSLVASVLTLNESEILTTTHPPQVASVGLPFLLVELSSVNSLVRAQIDISKLKLFFEKALGKNNWKYLERLPNKKGYYLTSNAKYIATVDSTLGYECFSRGQRVCFFSIRSKSR